MIGDGDLENVRGEEATCTNKPESGLHGTLLGEKQRKQENLMQGRVA